MKIRNISFATYNKKSQKQIENALKAGRVILSERTDKTEKLANLHYTTNHSAKMSGVFSLSSSVLSNPICQNRRNVKGSICSFCFSAAQMKTYKNMDPIFTNNMNILSSRLLSDNEIPVIINSSHMFRVESFGDAANVLQAANYLRICAANPWQNCAIWTKNPAFYEKAIKLGFAEKAKNTTLILSSMFVNKPGNIEHYPHFNKVFTVYSPEYITENNININCGARSCATCQRCYKNIGGVYVNEKLK